MEWAIPGILYAFFNSVVIFLNEKYHLNSFMLGMWRGFGSFVVCLPLAFLVPMPDSSMFFIFAAIQGLFVGYFDYKLFTASSRFGAGGTAMMTVLAIVISIFLWWLVQFKTFWDLIHDPKVFIGILLSICGCVGGYIHLVGKKMSKELFFFMLPAVAVLSIMTINSKFIISRTSFESAAVYYILIIGLVGGAYNLVGYFTAGRHDSVLALKKDFMARNSLIGGSLMVFASVLLMLTKNFAMRSIPNPGYLNILALTSPLWILLLNRLLKQQTQVSIPAVLVTLGSIALLVYFSSVPLPPMPY